MSEQGVSEKAVARLLLVEHPDGLAPESDKKAMREALADVAPELEAEWRERLARWARQKAAQGRSREEPHVHVEHWEKLADAVLVATQPHSGQPGQLRREVQDLRDQQESGG